MPGRPDILWIVTTQWRAQAFGHAGDPNARTPRLDAFAGAALAFTQAVTPHPFGPFARAALLTGVASPANGVVDYFDPLPRDAATVPRELAARGYATAFFGKWHLASRDPAAPLVGEPHARMKVPAEDRGGFEFWEGFESGFLLNDPWLHGSRLPEPARFSGYQADIVCRRAADWWRAPGGRPRFCLVSLESPHPPYDAPAPGVEPRDPAALILGANVPRGGATEARARRELAGYYAHGEATDRAVGALLAAADSAPAPAIIVFTSAHGDMHGAHGLFRKGWPYEESIRVPLLVRGKGVRSQQLKSDNLSSWDLTPLPGKSDALVSLLDLPAWTLAWADGGGLGAPTGRQVISMPSVVRLKHQCDRVWSGWRTRSRKVVRNADGTPWLSFDLENDPLELRNRAGEPGWSQEP
jgi:arylsulfatase A-like enzyme